MVEQNSDILSSAVRGDWIRLRTLIMLRWLAVAGQVVSVLVATQWLDLVLPLAPVIAVIIASALFNLFTMITNPRTRRLREGHARTALFFDLMQLVVLLFLTGGLGNPFCFLLLAPITISATALSLGSTLWLGGASLLMITGLVYFHIPLTTVDGAVIAPPQIFVFGTWVSLIVGSVFVAAYARRVTVEIYLMSEGLNATQMALEREHKLTDIGGVVAAAAHELGTPLATIKLVSGELEEELADSPDLLEDVRLIRSQADRCRDILQDMGRMGRDDTHLRVAPVSAVVEESAEPHQDRGKRVEITINENPISETPQQPQITRKPEIIHGLRNLVQNAVDFAQSSVWIDISWDEAEICVTIEDDGRGFSQEVLARIGDPFVRNRIRFSQRNQRPAYEGMGLGMFIAKTLLERSGARLVIENALADMDRDTGIAEVLGAKVSVYWPLAHLSVSEEFARRPLGENTLNRT